MNDIYVHTYIHYIHTHHSQGSCKYISFENKAAFSISRTSGKGGFMFQNTTNKPLL